MPEQEASHERDGSPTEGGPSSGTRHAGHFQEKMAEIRDQLSSTPRKRSPDAIRQAQQRIEGMTQMQFRGAFDEFFARVLEVSDRDSNRPFQPAVIAGLQFGTDTTDTKTNSNPGDSGVLSVIDPQFVEADFTDPKLKLDGKYRKADAMAIVLVRPGIDSYERLRGALLDQLSVQEILVRKALATAPDDKLESQSPNRAQNGS